MTRNPLRRRIHRRQLLKRDFLSAHLIPQFQSELK
jgi:hypothetical protein